MEESVSPEEKNAVNEKIGEVQSAVENVADDVAVVTAADQPGDTVTDIDSKGESAGASGPKIKDHFKGKVTKLSLAGALVDIGLDIPAAIHITQIARPEGAEFTNNIHDLLTVGQEVDVWVKKVKDGRIELTMIKPYDLEWREIKKDMVVKGTVVRMEDIRPPLAGILLRRLAGELRPVVHMDHGAAGIGRPDDRGDGLGEPAVALLAALEAGRCVLLQRQVDDEAHPGESRIVGHDGRRAHQHRHPATVLAQQLALEGSDLATGLEAPHPRVAEQRVVRPGNPS